MEGGGKREKNQALSFFLLVSGALGTRSRTSQQRKKKEKRREKEESAVRLFVIPSDSFRFWPAGAHIKLRKRLEKEGTGLTKRN